MRSDKSEEDVPPEEEKCALREVIVEEPEASEDSSEDYSSEEERKQKSPSMTFLQILAYPETGKIYKDWKSNRHCRSFMCLKDHDLSTEINQTAIQEIGGLEILINLLEPKT
ncbi:unnamed protein product [Acanthoscelides obtectus]|uniref:Uncharacterized protein n=1 Tax=Acanthoscelides obtectus TaxID=200917 RepID=A0A9P0QE85_ACAOB|nr:unnamed protein product [Acanthoscelides obtectus]CAK1688621.1 Armadillo repeat-containing protein gudu [Acanthoscelides obtectus]